MTHGTNFGDASAAAHSQEGGQASKAGEHAAGTFPLNAVRLERQVAFDLLAGEVSHELTHTLMFLRWLAEGAGQPALSAENGVLARQQIDRVQNVLRQLRRLTLPPPAQESIQILGAFKHAAAEISGLLVERRIDLLWAVDDRLLVRTEGALFSLLARYMLAAVIRDAEPCSTVEVHASPPIGLEDGTIEICRTQDDPSRSTAGKPFDPWAAMSRDAADMDLPICSRVARTLGWELTMSRDAGRTGLRLRIRAACFVTEVAR